MPWRSKVIYYTDDLKCVLDSVFTTYLLVVHSKHQLRASCDRYYSTGLNLHMNRLRSRELIVA